MQLEQLTGRVLFPTMQQGPWLPYERFAEVIASRPNEAVLHSHRLEEVVNYVISGTVIHQDDRGERAEVEAESVIVLSTGPERSHDVYPAEGRAAHWIAIGVELLGRADETESVLQIVHLPEAQSLQKGVLVRQVVGSRSPARSIRGLEVVDLEFKDTEEVALRRPCGLGHREVAYVLYGSGSVDGLTVAPGAAVLTEDVPSVEVRGSPGFRVLIATAPSRPG
ncbi:MAG: pirin family protein [Thermoplasmata archaeon]